MNVGRILPDIYRVQISVCGHSALFQLGSHQVYHATNKRDRTLIGCMPRVYSEPCMGQGNGDPKQISSWEVSFNVV
jgi:hypothetical protein